MISEFDGFNQTFTNKLQAGNDSGLKQMEVEVKVEVGCGVSLFRRRVESIVIGKLNRYWRVTSSIGMTVVYNSAKFFSNFIPNLWLFSG